MPGGYAHSPVWAPYALYGTVDYIYGWPAWNDGVGFTAAQGALNIVESSMYGYYLFELLRCGQGTGWFKVWDASWWTRKTAVQGDRMALAVLICLSGAVMTVSKTVLYCEFPTAAHADTLQANHRHRAQRVFQQLCKRWPQRLVPTNSPLGNSQWCMACCAFLDDLRPRQRGYRSHASCWECSFGKGGVSLARLKYQASTQNLVHINLH